MKPIHFIIKDGADQSVLAECPNYTGYIPHEKDWVRINSHLIVRVVSRTFMYNSSGLECVILEV